MKKIQIVLVFLFCAWSSYAQQKYNDKDLAKKPYWIAMMDDKNVNYFDAVHAFEVYWQNHKMPEGESDMDITQKAKNKRRFSKKEQREAREEAAMRMHIKKFNWWKDRVEPYVQENGSIQMPQPEQKN